MKLIDLVKDLPWPDGAVCVVQDNDGALVVAETDDVLLERGIWTVCGSFTVLTGHKLSEDWQASIVTHQDWLDAQDKQESENHNLYATLPEITPDLWGQFNDTCLMTWHDGPQWAQVAVDFPVYISDKVVEENRQLKARIATLKQAIFEFIDHAPVDEDDYYAAKSRLAKVAEGEIDD